MSFLRSEFLNRLQKLGWWYFDTGNNLTLFDSYHYKYSSTGVFGQIRYVFLSTETWDSWGLYNLQTQKLQRIHTNPCDIFRYRANLTTGCPYRAFKTVSNCVQDKTEEVSFSNGGLFWESRLWQTWVFKQIIKHCQFGVKPIDDIFVTTPQRHEITVWGLYNLQIEKLRRIHTKKSNREIFWYTTKNGGRPYRAFNILWIPGSVSLRRPYQIWCPWQAKWESRFL